MLEPESEPYCECRYDPVTDTMDREDCFFHCDMEEESYQRSEERPALRKPPAIATRRDEDAA